MQLHSAVSVKNNVLKHFFFFSCNTHLAPKINKTRNYVNYVNLLFFWACVSSGKAFVLQLAVWGLRGVTAVILANNPLSGVLILASVFWTSPWQALLGTLGVLTSTLTAVVMGQDR